MMHIYFILYAVIVSLQDTEAQLGDSRNENLIISLKQGQVQGTSLNSTRGIVFSAFLGIPYGKVVKRFTDPEPADSWKGIRDATKYGPACKQYDTLLKHALFGQEDDCLVLNVYTPKLPRVNTESLIPVMVFIHGGGFVMGDGSSTLYGPELYMNKEIVLVLMNFRVGPLGFLSTGDKELPGNYGLMDQVLALHWVKENIEKFGGDPNRVTLSGISAGGASVVFHLLSPLSAGLFHRAIAQSGSALCPWALQRSPLITTQKIAAKVNCLFENTTLMVECLRESDADLLSKAGDISDIPGSLTFLTVPVVENPTNGRFLLETPIKLLSEGKFNKVPVISGVTSDEAALFVRSPFSSSALPSLFNSMKIDWTLLIKATTSWEQGTSKPISPTIIEAIQKKYFSHISSENSVNDFLLRIIQLATDANFKSGNDKTVKLLAAAGMPVYTYVWTYAANVQVGGKHATAFHGIDSVCFFNGTKSGFINYTIDGAIQECSDKVLDLWVNFATTGNPTPLGIPLEWTPTPISPIKYLNISTHLEMEEDFTNDALTFWDNIFYT